VVKVRYYFFSFVVLETGMTVTLKVLFPFIYKLLDKFDFLLSLLESV
jgi:hypothetical protein